MIMDWFPYVFFPAYGLALGLFIWLALIVAPRQGRTIDRFQDASDKPVSKPGMRLWPSADQRKARRVVVEGDEPDKAGQSLASPPDITISRWNPIRMFLTRGLR